MTARVFILTKDDTNDGSLSEPSVSVRRFTRSDVGNIEKVLRMISVETIYDEHAHPRVFDDYWMDESLYPFEGFYLDLSKVATEMRIVCREITREVSVGYLYNTTKMTIKSSFSVHIEDTDVFTEKSTDKFTCELTDVPTDAPTDAPPSELTPLVEPANTADVSSSVPFDVSPVDVQGLPIIDVDVKPTSVETLAVPATDDLQAPATPAPATPAPAVPAPPTMPRGGRLKNKIKEELKEELKDVIRGDIKEILEDTYQPEPSMSVSTIYRVADACAEEKYGDIIAHLQLRINAIENRQVETTFAQAQAFPVVFEERNDFYLNTFDDARGVYAGASVSACTPAYAPAPAYSPIQAYSPIPREYNPIYQDIPEEETIELPPRAKRQRAEALSTPTHTTSTRTYADVCGSNIAMFANEIANFDKSSLRPIGHPCEIKE